jgi:hypothetical protein
MKAAENVPTRADDGNPDQEPESRAPGPRATRPGSDGVVAVAEHLDPVHKHLPHADGVPLQLGESCVITDGRIAMLRRAEKRCTANESEGRQAKALHEGNRRM